MARICANGVGGALSHKRTWQRRRLGHNLAGPFYKALAIEPILLADLLFPSSQLTAVAKIEFRCSGVQACHLLCLML